MTTERRQQQRRVADMRPSEAVYVAARHLLDTGGSDIAIIDGRLVRITAEVVTAEALEVWHEHSLGTTQ